MFYAAASVGAQTAEMPDAKRALVAEMIIATKADVRVEQTMHAMFKQMDDNYPMIAKGMVDGRSDIPAPQRARVVEELVKDHAKTQNFESRLISSIDFKDYINRMFYPLYDKFFTESELRDMLAFYKTPTGQKTLEVVPQLMAESIRLSQEILLPGLVQTANKIIDEDIARIKKTVVPNSK